MSYNSKQLVREEQMQYGTRYWDWRLFQQGPTSGRWLVSSWPTLEYDGAYYYFTSTDGAVHRLDRVDYGFIWVGGRKPSSTRAGNLGTVTSFPFCGAPLRSACLIGWQWTGGEAGGKSARASARRHNAGVMRRGRRITPPGTQRAGFEKQPAGLSAGRRPRRLPSPRLT